jgi:hypothetical protein
MNEALAPALRDFHEALDALRRGLGPFPDVRAQLLADSTGWDSLLRFKLLPQGEEPDCLVIAIGGGTNTGKSTLFNLLAGADFSAVRSTAAATCRPVLAAHPERARDCFEGRLLAGFETHLLEHTEDPLSREHAPNALFVAETENLPTTRVLLDTPDVDSIDLVNWEAAARIRAAGDLLLAILTGEKYQDDRVVQFFREAAASGRIVMNKANPQQNYEVARAQLEAFAESAGIAGAPLFAAPHDYNLSQSGGPEQIVRLDEPGTLIEYLDELDPVALKEDVYALTAARFVEQAGDLVQRIEVLHDTLHSVTESFEDAARRFALRYEPAPGAAVGGLFHKFVQSKRGPLDRAIGTASQTVARGIGFAGKLVRDAVISRTNLQPPAWEDTEEKVRKQNVNQIEQLASELAAHYIEQARNLAQPAGTLIAPLLDRMDMEAMVTQVAARTPSACSKSGGTTTWASAR